MVGGGGWLQELREEMHSWVVEVGSSKSRHEPRLW